MKKLLAGLLACVLVFVGGVTVFAADDGNGYIETKFAVEAMDIDNFDFEAFSATSGCDVPYDGGVGGPWPPPPPCRCTGLCGFWCNVLKIFIGMCFCRP